MGDKRRQGRPSWLGCSSMWTSPKRYASARVGQPMRATGLVGFVFLLYLAGATSLAPAKTGLAPDARAARSLNVTDEAHLHVTRETGSTFYEEGSATGALPATVKVRFTVGTSISGSFTLYPRGGGSISGSGSAHLHSTGTYASFGGSMSVDRGSGRYAHARGRGGFYGVLNRRSSALTIQTTGRLSY